MTSHSRSRMRKPRFWLTLTASVATVGLLLTATPSTSPSYAAVDQSLPTWSDVQKAKNNQAATQQKITEIQALLVQLEQEVAATKLELENAVKAYAVAEDDLLKATERSDQLKEQLEISTKRADEAANDAAALVSLLYRSGGIDRTAEIFLQDDAEAADQLLDRLGSISKVTEHNTKVAEKATLAKNDAQTLGEQAEVVEAERERLRKEAQDRKEEAAKLAADAQARQAEQEEQKATLDAQLAALKDTTAKTVTGYQERVRQEAEQKRKEEEERRQNASTGPAGSSSGWSKPLRSYWVSEEFGGSRGHGGIDLAASMWTPIYAAAAGRVTACYEFSNYGNTIDITHSDGSLTRYAHQPYGGLVVSCGQWVSRGQHIGYVGSTGWSTGPHLHFETWPNTSYRVNPRGFMAARGVYF